MENMENEILNKIEKLCKEIIANKTCEGIISCNDCPFEEFTNECDPVTMAECWLLGYNARDNS